MLFKSPVFLLAIALCSPMGASVRAQGVDDPTLTTEDVLELKYWHDPNSIFFAFVNDPDFVRFSQQIPVKSGILGTLEPNHFSSQIRNWKEVDRLVVANSAVYLSSELPTSVAIR